MGVASLLTRAGASVQLWGRPGHASKRTVTLDAESQSYTIKGTDDPAFDVSGVAGVFVTTKAWAVRGALAHISQLRHLKNVPVIVLANGYVWRLQDEFAARLPLLRFGAAKMAVSETGRNGYRVVSSDGSVSWGVVGSGASPSGDERDLLGKIPSWHWSNVVEVELREKWLMNAVINTLCGSLRLGKNGLLRQHGEKVRQMLDECFALGVKRWGQWPRDMEFYQGRLDELVAATSENENSMARDVRLGEKTEIGELFPETLEDGVYPTLTAAVKVIDSF